jgi:uncharacterized Fe-S cluster protein YjdI
MGGKVKEYSNGEITVVWKPDLCIHSGECVKGSPEVFQPKERPWIKPDNSTSKQIMETIDKCPSGALSYKIEDKSLEKNKDTESGKKIEIKAMKGGPLMVPGEGVEVLDSDGNVRETKGRSIAFCRCGASANKPFCDGSHTSVEFE